VRRRAVLIVVLVVLAVAATGPARAPARLGDARCDGRTPSPAAVGVRIARDVRRGLGLPTSRPHVTAVERSPRARRRGTALGTVALTAPEARYVRARDAVQRVEGRARAYLLAHALRLYGGVSTEGRFPGRPFLAARLTRPRASVRHALAALLPVRVRVVRVRRTLHALGRVRTRVEGDTAVLAAAGIRFTGDGLDVRRNQIVVEVITARSDVRAFFARRYGDAVLLRVIATRPTRLACVPVGAYTPAPDGRSLLVRWTSGSAAKFVRMFVAETTTTVRVGAIERVPNGPVEEAGAERTATVALAAPLGPRTVLDAETGRRLPQVP
jgi:hypothetical protein